MPQVIDIPLTHQDRPTTKHMLPFRVLPGRDAQIEWDQVVSLADRSTRKIEMRIPIIESPYGNQCGAKIREMMEIFFAVEAKVDGLMKQVDDLTTQNVTQSGEISKLKNQLAEALRSNERLKTNGKSK